MTRLALLSFVLLFFFNDTATTEIYTLSLHDALPIWKRKDASPGCATSMKQQTACTKSAPAVCCFIDRKSTRLNSSHVRISYAVFCLKKKIRRYSALTDQRGFPRSAHPPRHTRAARVD